MNIGYDRRAGKTWSLVSWKSTEDPSPGVFIREFIIIDFLVSFFPIMCGHIQLYLYEYYLMVSIDR